MRTMPTRRTPTIAKPIGLLALAAGLAACAVDPDACDESDDECIATRTTTTFHIAPTVETFDGAANHVAAGDTICLDAGIHHSLAIKNVRGATGYPVLVTNCGGAVRFQATNDNYIIKIERSAYFKLSGRGTGGTYGIELDGQQNLAALTKPNLMGISIGLESTDFELESLDIHHTGFAGIMAKSEPDCQNDAVSPHRFVLDPVHKISHDTFIQRNTRIHDNKIHDTASGEGLYIGHSYYGGYFDTNTNHVCYGWTMYPSTLDTVSIASNQVSNTGAEAIQLGCALHDGEITNNLVRGAGVRPFGGRSDQTNGIQVGAGTEGKVSGNRIFNAAGSGIIMLGLGKSTITNNLIVNSGGPALFADDREGTVPNGEIDILNNTFVNSGGDGVMLYSDLSIYNLWNNLIVQPGTLASLGPAKAFVYRLSSNVRVLYSPGNSTSPGSNVLANTTAAAGFVDAAHENYDLVPTSVAVNHGVSVASHGVTTDILGRARPSGGAFDVGAFEQGAVAPTTPTGAPKVTGFTIINGVTDQPIGPLTNNMTLSFAAIGTSKISIRGDVSGNVASVVFGYDGTASYRLDNTAPYSMNGEANGDYAQWTPTSGAHTVTATASTQPQGQGTASTPLVVHFTVVP